MRLDRLPPRQILRWLAAAFGACVIAVAAVQHLTAESRIRNELHTELWRLRQRSPDAAELPESMRRELVARLQAEMPPLRWQAAQTLGDWRDRRTVSALLVALRDETGTRRTCLMAQALGHIGDPIAVPELVWASAHPTNIDLRMCATHALAEIGNASVLAPLAEKARRAADCQDRHAAIAALGELGNTEAVPVLRAIARNDASMAVRARALSALWQIGLLRDDAVPRLLGALGHHEHWVRDDWILLQLAPRWDHLCAAALNHYVASSGAMWSDRVRACALLLDRRALQPATLTALEIDTDRSSRFLAAELRRAMPANDTYATYASLH